MKTARPHSRYCSRALTVVELLVIVVIGCVLAVLFAPSLLRPKKKSHCVNNLKNIGLAFQIFATDNNGRYPMSLSFTNGGTREWVDDPAKVWMHYFVMSNEVSYPGLLVCSTDRDGRLKANYFATNFATAANYRPKKGDQQIPFSRNQNVSYFIGLAAKEGKPQMLLAGDRHLTNDAPVRFEYGKARVGNLPGSVGTGWDQRMHEGAGNVCQADGSVQIYNSSHLRDALRNSGDTENRIATPD